MADELTGFWAQDTWVMKECPLTPKTERNVRNIRFNCKSPSLNIELKYATWVKFIKGEWASSRHGQAAIRALSAWLNIKHANAVSFLEKTLEFWQTSFRTYLKEIGQWHSRTLGTRNKNQKTILYPVQDRLMSSLTQIYGVLEKFYDQRGEYEKDIWNVETLGIPKTDSSILNFTSLQQLWLKQATKQFIRFTLATFTFGTCEVRISRLNHFSRFLTMHHPQLPPELITRKVIEDYIAYLQKLNLGASTRTSCLCTLRQLFDLSVRFGWAAVPDKVLIYNDDYPKLGQVAPRFIPQDVLDPFLACLAEPETPREIECMVRVGLHTGARVSDLLAMRRDCLVQDAEGDYWIAFYIKKNKKDHSLPIDRELAQMIRDQQERAKEVCGKDGRLLFPNAKGNELAQQTVRRWINEIVVKHDIHRADGSLYRFEFHQLRHTCGTTMINSGYPPKVVQDWLGHGSPEMTDRYAKIFDKTKKEAFQKYLLARGPLINIKGEAVNTDSPVNGMEHQLLKEQIKDRRLALHNGHCTFPIALGNCPHFGACKKCQWFVTERRFLPEHEVDLRNVENDLATARRNGWQRRVENLEEDRASLRRIIAKLKEEL